MQRIESLRRPARGCRRSRGGGTGWGSQTKCSRRVGACAMRRARWEVSACHKGVRRAARAAARGARGPSSNKVEPPSGLKIRAVRFPGERVRAASASLLIQIQKYKTIQQPLSETTARTTFSVWRHTQAGDARSLNTMPLYSRSISAGVMPPETSSTRAPVPLRAFLEGHAVSTAAHQGWGRLRTATSSSTSETAFPRGPCCCYIRRPASCSAERAVVRMGPTRKRIPTASAHGGRRNRLKLVVS